MVFYNCEACNYITKNKTDFNKHNKTKKHKKNSETSVPKKTKSKISRNSGDESDNSAQRNSAELSGMSKNGTSSALKCDYCGLGFKRSFNMNRHLKTCSMKTDFVEKEKLQRELDKQRMIVEERERTLKEREKNFNRILKEKEKQLNEHKIEKEYYKELIDNYSKFGPKTFNSITYVMNKYENAPHIKMIEPEKIECFQNINMKKVENMVSDYRNNRFVVFIVNTIASIHKKENPEDQSIWSTDSSRYNYLIKELLDNEGSYWVVDKKGTKSRDYLIEPILKFIRKEIINYNELASESLMDENLPKSRFSIITDTQRFGIEIIKDIDDGTLSAEIIRKMAKHFHHKGSDNPLIEEVE